MCGRCGGDVFYAGSEGDIDWYGCSVCGDSTAEFDPIFNHDISLRQSPVTHLPHSQKKLRKWFNP